MMVDRTTDKLTSVVVLAHPSIQDDLPSRTITGVHSSLLHVGLTIGWFFATRRNPSSAYNGHTPIAVTKVSVENLGVDC